MLSGKGSAARVHGWCEASAIELFTTCESAAVKRSVATVVLANVPDDVQPADEWMIHLETVAQLRQLVGKLPEKDQRLVRMKYLEGLKYREISQQTGLTVSNVGFRLHQVLKKLADGLLPYGSE